MNETHCGYVSYLLRMWQVQENGDWVWRASLENSQTSQLDFFANLDDCFAFLHEQGEILSGADQQTYPKYNKGG
ncbi:MAG: hypothetical protein GY805_36605 [Chloroflexi bacterium]|nr:hypothetical protein [Chloroflexota bacterium]